MFVFRAHGLSSKPARLGRALALAQQPQPIAGFAEAGTTIPVTPRIMDENRSSAAESLASLLTSGMRLLRADDIEKIRQGITTRGEVARVSVCAEDEHDHVAPAKCCVSHTSARRLPTAGREKSLPHASRSPSARNSAARSEVAQ
jgi:hypothetical protein